MCCHCTGPSHEMNRREFLKVSTASVAAAGIGMSLGPGLLASMKDNGWDPKKPYLQIGKPLSVQPVLMYSLSERRPQTSWRPWGGLHTERDVDGEVERITAELRQMEKDAEFPLKCAPVVKIRSEEEAVSLQKQSQSDVFIIYAASGGTNVFEALVSEERNKLVFLRHRSGPVYLWYEIVHNRFLRKGGDGYDLEEFRNPGGVDIHDIVVDEPGELLWRVRALYGLKNTMGARIVTLGGPGGWCAPYAPDKARERFGLDFVEVSYDEMERRIQQAKHNREMISLAEDWTNRYLSLPHISLETDREFVRNAFVLYALFKELMEENNTYAFTIRQCMSTIIPMAETTACLPLMLLNDEGYLAFCESDFNVIPSGILLHYISGKPVFLNDPTYPHGNVVTCAHCTGPSRMNGDDYETTRVLTHFESDYGAAPKVEMPLGREVTIIDPDSYQREWVGFKGTIAANPFLDICRTQWDIRFEGDEEKLNQVTKGFHWMIAEGDYLRETEYAARKAGIEWLDLA